VIHSQPPRVFAPQSCLVNSPLSANSFRQYSHKHHPVGRVVFVFGSFVFLEGRGEETLAVFASGFSELDAGLEAEAASDAVGAPTPSASGASPPTPSPSPSRSHPNPTPTPRAILSRRHRDGIAIHRPQASLLEYPWQVSCSDAVLKVWGAALSLSSGRIVSRFRSRQIAVRAARTRRK
jgi:hypothetical protein